MSLPNFFDDEEEIQEPQYIGAPISRNNRLGVFENPPIQDENQSPNFFDDEETPQEDWMKQTVRYAYQPIAGVAQKFTYPADILNIVATGAAADPNEIEALRYAAERSGIEFDEEKYMNAVKEIEHYFPTQSNFERIIEENSGAPLTPQNRLQSLLRLGGLSGALKSGGATAKGVAAVRAPVVSAVANEIGFNEPISDILGLALPDLRIGSKGPGTIPGPGAGGGPGGPPPGAVLPSIGVNRKPSGIPKRQFENIQKPREVTENKFNKINQKVEGDFRKIADKIIETSPIEKTRTEMRANPAFKEESRARFKEVENIAQQIDTPLHTDLVTKKLDDIVSQKKGTKFAPTEYNRDFKKFIEQFKKDTKSGDISAVDLVSDYREVNKSLGESFERGNSYAYNRAKKDAMLAYNQAIAQLIEEQFPGSEFANLFKETNKQWAEIMDVEAINGFIDEMFAGKINYKQGKEFFDDANTARPFKRALGEEGYNNFRQLMKDTLESEQAMKQLRIAKARGFDDLFKVGMSYLVHPYAAITKGVATELKQGWKWLANSIIDKPELMISWRRGMDELKAGKFAQAERDLGFVNAEVEKAQTDSPKTRQGETINVKGERIAPNAKTLPEPNKALPAPNKQIEFKPPKEETKSPISEAEKIPETLKTKEIPKLSPKTKTEIKPIKTREKKLSKDEQIADYSTQRDEALAQKKEISKRIDRLSDAHSKAKDKKKQIILDRLHEKDHQVVQRIKDLDEEIAYIEESQKADAQLKKEISDMKRQEKTKKEKPLKTLTNEKVQDVKRQDISKKGLKMQKNYIVESVDDAIRNPKPNAKVDIDVPGDGQFSIHNNEKALNTFKERVEKNWPDKPLKAERKRKYPEYEQSDFVKSDQEILIDLNTQLESNIKKLKEDERYLKDIKLFYPKATKEFLKNRKSQLNYFIDMNKENIRDIENEISMVEKRKSIGKNSR